MLYRHCPSRLGHRKRPIQCWRRNRQYHRQPRWFLYGRDHREPEYGKHNPGATGATVGFRGIYPITDLSQLATINDNTIANITDNIVGNYAMYGIYSSLNALNAAGNVVRNMNGKANSPGVTITGILVSAPLATQPTTFSQNIVHSLSNTVTGGSAG